VDAPYHRLALDLVGVEEAEAEAEHGRNFLSPEVWFGKRQAVKYTRAVGHQASDDIQVHWLPDAGQCTFLDAKYVVASPHLHSSLALILKTEMLWGSRMRYFVPSSWVRQSTAAA
jgi:hypothetical protein